jgi:hypothetical protein
MDSSGTGQPDDRMETVRVVIIVAFIITCSLSLWVAAIGGLIWVLKGYALVAHIAQMALKISALTAAGALLLTIAHRYALAPRPHTPYE